jgi:hypothetical protein
MNRKSLIVSAAALLPVAAACLLLLGCPRHEPAAPPRSPLDLRDELARVGMRYELHQFRDASGERFILRPAADNTPWPDLEFQSRTVILSRLRPRGPLFVTVLPPGIGTRSEPEAGTLVLGSLAVRGHPADLSKIAATFAH